MVFFKVGTDFGVELDRFLAGAGELVEQLADGGAAVADEGEGGAFDTADDLVAED